MACLKLNLVRREVTSRTKKNSNETSKWLEYKISSLFFESCYKSQNCYPMFWKFRGGGKCPKCSPPGCSPATGYAVMRSWCKLQLNEILKCQKRIKRDVALDIMNRSKDINCMPFLMKSFSEVLHVHIKFWRWRHKEGMFWKFWPPLTGPEPQPIDPFFWLKLWLKTRSKSASIEPWIDLLAYL